MDIADEYLKLRILLSDCLLISLIKKVAMSEVSLIIPDSVTGKKSPHKRGKAVGTASQ